MNVVERVSGGISAGGGMSSGITSGPLAGLIVSCAIYHKNLCGRNQKVNLSLERGQVDAIFRINYTDPWIEGDDKRISRSVMVQLYSISLEACFSESNDGSLFLREGHLRAILTDQNKLIVAVGGVITLAAGFYTTRYLNYVSFVDFFVIQSYKLLKIFYTVFVHISGSHFSFQLHLSPFLVHLFWWVFVLVLVASSVRLNL